MAPGIEADTGADSEARDTTGLCVACNKVIGDTAKYFAELAGGESMFDAFNAFRRATWRPNIRISGIDSPEDADSCRCLSARGGNVASFSVAGVGRVARCEGP